MTAHTPPASTALYPAYPPDLSDEQRDYLLTNLKDWSIAHGLAVRPAPSYVAPEQDPAGALATTAPVTLFPSLFPRVCFEQATAVARAYNDLYSAIASDEGWLQEIMEELVEIDDFMAELWKVHLAVKAEGYVQPLHLGLFRSDYMVHVDPSDPGCGPSVKQVEFNTIASSFGGLSNQVSALHRYLLSIDAYPESVSALVRERSVPAGTSVAGLARGLARAHAAYGASAGDLPTCVVFLVQDPERNVFDQRHLEYALNADHGVQTFRLPFGRVLTDTTVDDDDDDDNDDDDNNNHNKKKKQRRRLIYRPPHAPAKRFEVTVVYFRAGYAPSEYQGRRDWDARRQIERSGAIKCPSILTHLAGTKKVQQVLATPHSPHLRRFLPEAGPAAAVLATFAPIYPLDASAAGQEARRLATDAGTAARYVLKPQREGGGNNVYRQAIPGFLRQLPETHWPAHILMEMIEPPAQANVIFRNGAVQQGGVVCELGVYGACLWKTTTTTTTTTETGTTRAHDGVASREVLENFEAGYLLRTKGSGSEEGGVAAGFGSVDSACLIDV